MLMDEYKEPQQTKIPSINGGLPITMSMKKGKVDSLGGSFKDISSLVGLNKTGTQVAVFNRFV